MLGWCRNASNASATGNRWSSTSLLAYKSHSVSFWSLFCSLWISEVTSYECFFYLSQSWTMFPYTLFLFSVLLVWLQLWVRPLLFFFLMDVLQLLVCKRTGYVPGYASSEHRVQREHRALANWFYNMRITSWIAKNNKERHLCLAWDRLLITSSKHSCSCAHTESNLGFSMMPMGSFKSVKLLIAGQRRC